MSHIAPLPLDQLPDDLREVFEERQRSRGFVANSLRTMAHRPAILRAFQQLNRAVYDDGEVPRGLKALVALMRSQAAGCRYCQAHTATFGARNQVEQEKLSAIWEFESNPIFDDRERAALRLARDAAVQPNAVTEDHFVELKAHFDDGQIVEIVAVISLFGWLNTWNDTFATELEDNPLALAEDLLGASGWEAGKHR